MPITRDTLTEFVQWPANWFITQLDDWLFFLQGPRPPVFQHPHNFDRMRLLKLLIFVTLSSSIILGITTVTVSGLGRAAAEASSYPIVILISSAATLSVVYSLSAKVFRIPVTISDVFYVILFMTLPWLPPTALVFALGSIMQVKVVGFLTALWMTFTLVMILIYVGLGVSRIVHNCPAWRCWLSVITPVVLFIGLVIFVISAIQIPIRDSSSGENSSPPSPTASPVQ